jgi:hypothetical protein
VICTFIGVFYFIPGGKSNAQVQSVSKLTMILELYVIWMIGKAALSSLPANNFSTSVRWALCGIFVGVCYVFKKSWIVNNFIGMGFSILSLEMLELNDFTTGCVLLILMTIFDVSMVFGSDKMTKAVNSLKGNPFLLLFPRIFSRRVSPPLTLQNSVLVTLSSQES